MKAERKVSLAQRELEAQIAKYFGVMKVEGEKILFPQNTQLPPLSGVEPYEILTELTRTTPWVNQEFLAPAWWNPDDYERKWAEEGPFTIPSPKLGEDQAFFSQVQSL